MALLSCVFQRINSLIYTQAMRLINYEVICIYEFGYCFNLQRYYHACIGPTLKLKRHFIAEKYLELIAALYSDDGISEAHI